MRRDFAALLDDIMREEAEVPADTASTPHVVDYLAVLDELAGRVHIAHEEAVAGYRDAILEEEVFTLDPEIEVMDADPAVVERELGLAAAKSLEELNQRRRTFALGNHPDRVRPELRDIALRRMQIANMLVDEAKRTRFSEARRR